MDLELRTIADCPNSAPAQALFMQALELEGLDPAAVAAREITNEAEAVDLNFHGSPSFIIAGGDLFDSTAEPAVACRVYPTRSGLQGLPELDSLRDAVRSATQAAAV